MLLILVLLLAGLTAYTMMQPTGTDFLRIGAYHFGAVTVTVKDLLIGLGIIGIVLMTRGPLMVASAAMFVLWGTTLFGVNNALGFDASPVIVWLIIIAGVIHVVTYKDH